MASQSKNNSGSKSGMSASSKSSSSRSTPSKRGFAAMSPEKQREIASMGGKAAHAKGTAHQFTSEEAREAGRKGGSSSRSASSRSMGDSARN